MGFINLRKHNGRWEPKLATLCDRSESDLIDDVNKIATKVPFETSIKRPGVEGKPVAVGIPSHAKTGLG